MLNITQRTFSLLAYLAVGLRLDFLSICWHPSISVQVIYKKFQIACPFEEFSVNGTANLLSLNISSAHSHDGHDGHEYTNGVAHEDDDSHCATHLFTINSQVGSCIEHWLCLSCFFFFIQRAPPVWEFPWLLFFHDESSYLSMSPLPGRPRTLFPSSLLPLCATRRYCPSTPSSASESSLHRTALNADVTLALHVFNLWNLSLILVHPSRECRRCPTSPSLSCTLCTSWRLSLATWPLKVRAGARIRTR